MTHWKAYHKVLIPCIPQVSEPEESIEEIKKLMKKSHCYMARWTTDFDSDVYKDFYYLVCDKFIEVEDVELRKVRNELRRAFKYCSVKIISKKSLIEQGYNVYDKAFKKYITNVNKMNKQQFEEMVENLDESIDIWGVFYDSILVGWGTVKVYDKFCDFQVVKYDPDFLKFEISAAINYSINQYYIKKHNKFIIAGTKSLNHDTNIQNYLVKKFNYKRRYCKLHVVYIWYVQVLVRFLYPFRKFFYKFKTGVFSKIAVVLRHEEIIRSQKKLEVQLKNQM
ncbi:hypothetical protein IEO70_04550 [Bacillus sp. AGMB 02131]|uniref:Uncharacterized protein n=1 Tax=Peribacillus faecalis TaxID=2772559 RepID=A0A927CTM0_9BACI|nr:hypothetical protein [Peribacillus faecalis]MBD3107628.1 hypothetical protein [Peribacillus faecalis]